MNQNKYNKYFSERRRRQETVDALVSLLIVVLIALLFYIFFRVDRTSYFAESYVVCRGDTLDGLYYRYGGGNLERWRYEMKKANGMETSGLSAGEEIILLRAE